MMKLYTSTLLAAFVFISCSDKPQANKSGAAATIANTEKNRQVALKNEVTEITRLVQKIERQGRAMDSYRVLPGAEGARQCAAIMNDQQKQTADLEARIKNLPENYNARLTPIIGELNDCVSCAKNAIDGCKKARASINQAIKEIY